MKHLGYTHSAFKLGYDAAALLPRGICQGLGSTLGLASYLATPASRVALRQNLKRVTGIDGFALDRLCRTNFQNFGRMLADYFYATGQNAESVRALLGAWHGIGHLRSALEAGRGVVLITAHLGNWELGGSILALDGFPMNVVTLKEPTSELTAMRDRYRKKLGTRTIILGEDKFAFVEMVAALKRNEIVCMLVDRPYGETGTPVEFFGKTAPFSTAPALLWEHTGAAVVPAFVLQSARNGYSAIIQPSVPLERAPNRQESLARNTQHIADVFEKTIRNHPEQWFNYIPIWNNEAP